MSQQNEEKQQINPKQNNYFPIILWLFPLLLLNIGWKFSNFIYQRWLEQERIEKANQEVESLSSNSDFTYYFASTARNFNNILKSNVELFVNPNQENILVTYIKNNSEHLFKSPFPNSEITVFKTDNNFNNTNILYTNNENANSLNNIFESFVKIDSNNTEEQESTTDEAAKSVFTDKTTYSILAKSQRGKVSFVTFNSKPHYFIWDYFNHKDSGNSFGFFIFVENNEQTKNASKLLAISQLKENQKNNKTQNFGAFIPLFPNAGNLVTSEEITKEFNLYSALKKWIPKDVKDLSNWQKNGLPTTSEEIIIDNYQPFFHIAPNQTYASVLFVPLLETPKTPIWLIIVNSIVLLTIIFFLLRGLVFGIWPKTSLKGRFLTTYFLAACLPLGLLVIASYGYISEYKHTVIIENQSKLKLCIEQFDNSKIQVQDGYKKAFQEIQSNQNIIKAFHNLNNTYENFSDGISHEALDVLVKSLNIINKENRNLPIDSFAIISERGDYWINDGIELKTYYKTFDNKEFSSQNFDLNIKEKILNKNITGIYSKLLNSLRQQIIEKAPDKKRWSDSENINTESYRNEVFDENQYNKIITNSSDNNTNSIIFNFISIEGIPRFAICLNWNEEALDEKTYISCLRNFGIKEPNYIFAAYKTNSQGINSWPETLDRHSIEIKDSSLEVIKQAYFRNNIASKNNEQMSIIAVPSKKYKDVIFIGGVFYHTIEIDIFKRIWFCIAVILVALLIFLLCVHFSEINFINPIVNLKSLLDKIDDGNLDTQILSNSKDEFGLLCNEFNKMTYELSERNKLASLISDHAIEAMSKNEVDKEISNITTFEGTIMVSDIRNFTGMCETYEPNQVTELLNNHFAEMTKIISANGGRIYKFVGDAIEAIFANDDDSEKSSVERAFIAGSEMINTLKKINENRRSKNLFEYKIGIGLSYGTMTSGTVGSLETRLDYAIIGNILNKASKLESLSVENSDFPLIADKAFINKFNQIFPDIKFINLDKSQDIDGFKISDNESLTIINKIVNDKNNSQSKENNKIKDNNKSEKSTHVYEVNEYFSFKRKFIPGAVFILILAIIMSLGIYFVFTTANNSEKITLSVTNNRDLKQILSDEYGKTVFDTKCRDIAENLKNKIDSLDEKDISDEIIEKCLTDYYKSDKSLDGLTIKSIFIRANKYPDINTNDTAFIDKITLKPIANQGYTDKEKEVICNIFKINIALNSLDTISKKLYLSEKENKDFKTSSINYMKTKYSDPCSLIFGDKLSMNIFKNNGRNASLECLCSGNPSYIFWLDYYKEENSNPFGFLLISIPIKQIKESLPAILSTFSRDDAIISLRNKDTEKWYFSDNITEELKNEYKNTNHSNFSNILGATCEDEMIIGENKYDLYITRLCTLNKGNPSTALFWSFVIILITAIILLRISKGISRINYSIEAKLWVALLIVAVVPVISVAFVFGLFRSEYFSVKSSAQKAEMQRFAEIYEQKGCFSSPLIWNFINNKNNSSELLKYISEINNNQSELTSEGTKDLNNLVQSWINERKPWDEYNNSLVNFSINDVYIYGKNNWKFTLNSDKTNKTQKDIIKIIENNISKISSNINYRTSNDDNLINIPQYGNEFYLKLINNINSPIYINTENGKIGFLLSAIPNKDNIEALIVWIIDFNDTEYLTNLSSEINSKYSITFTDKTKYGEIYKNNGNNLRIPLGKYASWISTTDLPISTIIKINNISHFLEGKPSLNNHKALALVTYPEQKALEDIIYFSVVFYCLLGISLIIIIHTTRKIAEDIINPINGMMKAIREINKDNFAYRINSDREDELGDLCNSFDKMVKGIEEKQLMAHMLSNTAKKSILKEGGAISSKSESILLYVGIPEFISINSTEKDSSIFEKLRKQTELVAKIIIEEGGEVDKIIGDKLLAVFPVEQDKNQAAKAACMAAKRLIEQETANKLPLPISIGINFGNIIKGFIGVGNKRDFTVIGDAVNVSARIESISEKLEKDRCLISDSFNELVSNAFKTEFYGNVELKGKSQPMKVYQLY